MDNQHRRDPQVADDLYNHGLNTNHASSQNGQSNSTRHASCSQMDIPRLSTSLPPPYGLHHIPQMAFDPALYSSMPRTMLPTYHPEILNQSSSQLPISSSNRLNPLFLVSSNDNNNCNRARAASHSTVLEMQQSTSATAAHLPFCPIPTYLPNPYYDPHKYPDPSTCRRNSTTSAFSNPHGTTGSHIPLYPPGTNFHLPYVAPHYDYILNRHQPPPYASYKGIYPQPHSIQTPVRRDRYSVGGPLPTSEIISNETTIRRRNSIPTTLEVVQVSDGSSEDPATTTSVDEDEDDEDDDDVFDSSTPVTAPHSATDPASYLEQLRESRKRALSGGNMMSQSKYLCQDNSNLYPRARFRGRLTRVEYDPNASDEQKTRLFNRESAFAKPIQMETDIPGTSAMQIPKVQILVDDQERSNDAKAGNTSGKVIKDSKSEDASLSVSKSSIPDKSTHSLRVISAAPRTLTPSPSILKKSKIRLNRNNHVTSSSGDKGESSSETVRQKTFRPKKQVAWKDDLKPTKKDICDEIITPMKHDLLSEQNLLKIKKNPSVFTCKNRIGPYVFGPLFGASPVRSISQYLVRKENTFKYYMAKVLNMGGNSVDDRSGRMLLYSEYSLLTLLKNHPGVIREHGFHKDMTFDPKTGRVQERLCLILDCLSPHEFDESTIDCLNLQQHVIKVKRLSERETIRIFTSIVEVMHSLHQMNVVHRDLKLGNMVFLRKSHKVILTNFCLGRHLMSDGELLKDQRGSPAYISPDVLSGKPYAGKPSDMWSLGVVLFMMLYGQFPFYDQEPPKLFKKIKKADFVIPSNPHTTSQINDIIRGLLTLDPTQRLTASETLVALKQCAWAWSDARYSTIDAQVVPDVDNVESEDDDKQKKDEEDEKYEEAKLTEEFRLKMLSYEENDSTENRNEGFGRRTYQSTLPTIQHCPYDARPLTENEIALHRQLLVNSTLGVRVQGTT
uniref:uncharacterized protein LOC120337384 n=1 Tax=Styela clava TaxID=7725 RepID=UPI001939B5A5|nr:uncharacterized protein LOC120337384 [Styela clava]